MRRLLAVVLLLGMSVPALAQEPPEDPPVTNVCGTNVVHRALCLVGAGVWVPVATALLVGELWDAACTRSGFEFIEDPEGSAQWRCTGVPRPPE